jgi:glycine/D-amino acid oxidase-like deaminating enzyme
MKMLNSIWAETALPQFPRLQGDKTTQILIIGGGMAGLLCAFRLKQAGADVLLVEAGRICGGVTQNTTAKITSQHGLIYHKLLHKLGREKAGMYLQANQQAVADFHALCKDIPCHFESQSAFVYSLDDRQALEQEVHALHLLGYPAGLKEDLPLPFHTVGAVKFRHQAQFHPLEFAAHIARDLPIYENTPVRVMEGTTAITDHGRIRAEKVIVATHFPFLNRHSSYFLKLYQHRSYVLALENANFPGGMYIGSEENSLSLRAFGNQLLLGGGGHRTGKQGGGWKELSAFAARAYPQAQEIARWATQDCISLDGVPYIGQYSRNTPNLFVATGFNKWGMTGSMVAAKILTNLILEQENPWAEVFSPSRSILKPQLAINGSESVLNLLRPTVPRCPHMGCALKWNAAERSWDCTCHGSRFAEDGKLLNNPAQKRLKS